MNDLLNKNLLTEAIRIGDEILDNAKSDEHGIYWETMQTDTDNSIIWTVGESIYKGVSGIILFYIELYRHTQDERYKEAILKSANWLIHYCRQNPTDYFAFYTGRMGTVYTLMALAEFTGNNDYYVVAVELAGDCEKFLESEHSVDDLINGNSGALLGLLHLHQATKNNDLLKPISKFINHLLTNAHLGDKGIYWDRDSKSIRGLCGFSHGASGIGFVFMELGYYFKNEAFSWVAEQTFAYENQYFDEEAYNWPDFRKGIYDEETLNEHKKAFLDQDNDFFSKHSFMSAWCHGAPGIGLSRLRAIELGGNEKHSKHLKKSTDHVKQILPRSIEEKYSYTLCHGVGGNSMLLLDTYKHSKDESLLTSALKAGQIGLEAKKSGKPYLSGLSIAKDMEDASLFMGNSGIGYFYLNLIDPLNTPSILKPTLHAPISQSVDGIANYKIEDIKLKLIGNKYPLTLKVYNHYIYKQKSEFPVLDSQDFRSDFEFKVEDYLLNNKETELLKDVFAYEKAKVNLDESRLGNSFVHIKNHIELSANNEILERQEGFEAARLMLNTSSKIVNTKWNWAHAPENLNDFNEQKGDYYTVLVSTPTGVEAHALNEFAYLVIENFTTPQRVSEAMTSIEESFEINSEEEKILLKQHILMQIEESLKINVLVEQV